MNNDSFDIIGCDAEVSKTRVADLLCAALEGGSNYWYEMSFAKSTKPNEVWQWDVGDSDTVFKHIQWPMSEGGNLFITNSYGDPEEGHLDLKSMEKGLQLMHDKYPSHWKDFIEEQEDANTGDVFLQLSLFGELVYG